jgi:hypothetical protein
MVVKEKLNGTNATIFIPDDMLYTMAGSKNQWITPERDNYGFAAWVRDHAEELKSIGPGWHRGEWHGSGINGNQYGLSDKRFALFDHKYHDEWKDRLPACCSVVPVLLKAQFSTYKVNTILGKLRERGSVMYPGKPAEGLVVWLPAAQVGFKVLCVNDAISKGQAESLSSGAS